MSPSITQNNPFQNVLTALPEEMDKSIIDEI